MIIEEKIKNEILACMIKASKINKKSIDVSSYKLWERFEYSIEQDLIRVVMKEIMVENKDRLIFDDNGKTLIRYALAR